jgi:large subunit ribosomal protein L18
MANKSRNEARLKRHRRVRKTVYGSPERPRLNVFRSGEQIYAQIINDDAQHTLVSASSIDHELRSELVGKTKTEEAKLVGALLARRALEKGVKTVVFDRGGFRYIGRVKALADAAREGGMDF